VYTGLYLSNICALKKHLFLQLWHGMPLKTLGYTEQNIAQKFYNQYSEHADAGRFFVSSDIFKLSMISSFLMNPKNVYITGQAKTDCILSNRNHDKLKEYLKIENYSKVIIYAPTYKEAERNNRKDIKTEFRNIAIQFS
jgi:CDP-glycerol glycerophosphotransferase (TagB/SpsB family)